jgi:hypothetical protein
VFEYIHVKKSTYAPCMVVDLLRRHSSNKSLPTRSKRLVRSVRNIGDVHIRSISPQLRRDAGHLVRRRTKDNVSSMIAVVRVPGEPVDRVRALVVLPGALERERNVDVGREEVGSGSGVDNGLRASHVSTFSFQSMRCIAYGFGVRKTSSGFRLVEGFL